LCRVRETLHFVLGDITVVRATAMLSYVAQSAAKGLLIVVRRSFAALWVTEIRGG